MKATPIEKTLDPGHFNPAVPLEQIAPSKTNPRKTFEIDDLADSIKEKGVIQPIVLRPHPKASKPIVYEIVAGERRFRASKKAGKDSIPAMVRKLDDTAVLELQVIENLQREDIHELEEAEGYRRLMKEADYDAKTLADKVGKSVEYIYARLKLLELDKDLQKMFFDGDITAGHAVLLARLPGDSQKTCKANLFIESWNSTIRAHSKTLMSVRDLSYFIQHNIHMDLSKAVFDVADAALVKKAGACADCPKRTGAAQQLFPEIKGQDLCLDRSCYTAKATAHVKALVEENDLVKITDNWRENREKGSYHHNDIREVKKNACKFVQRAIHIDGHLIGKIVNVCVSENCKEHSRGSYSSGVRHKSTPQERFETTKSNIDTKVRDEVRDRIYAATYQRLKLFDHDVNKVLKHGALRLILRMIYNRADSTSRAALTEELELKRGQYSKAADTTSFLKSAEKLTSSQTMGLIMRVALRDLSMGFGSSWENGRSGVDKELEDIAREFGAKVSDIKAEAATLKAEKLSKAKARLAAAIEKGKPKPVKKGKPEAVKTGKVSATKPVQTSTDDDDVEE